jgi:stearoyl-CoA desaturase (delta-9 desaturase)
VPQLRTLSAHRPLREHDEGISRASSIPFLLCHLAPLAAIFTGITRTSLVLFAILFVSRMWFITAGYHRYFAHRAYRTSRFFQFVLAFGGGTAAQQGALWWAANHRDHHRYTDTERDPHTPQKGFWWSHIGWVLSGKYSSDDLSRIDDFAKYPELLFLEHHQWIAPWTAALAAFLIGGWPGLVVGFFGSTVLLWHSTFSVNSLAHMFGTRRFGTNDTSRNNALVAAFTLGEGWHNNHHHYPACARQGFYWYEYDPTYWGLRVLAALHVVHDLKQPPAVALESRRLRRGHLDIGMFKAHLTRAGGFARAGASIATDERVAIEQALRELADTASAANRRRPLPVEV